MELTAAQELPGAEAAARHWGGQMEPLAVTDAPYGRFCAVHWRQVAAERYEQRLGAETQS